MMNNRIIRYGVVPVNPLYVQIASTSELKIPLIGFHLLAVMINRINRTMRGPPINNGHQPIFDLL